LTLDSLCRTLDNPGNPREEQAGRRADGEGGIAWEAPGERRKENIKERGIVMRGRILYIDFSRFNTI
jgi:hypothetical protein